MFITLTMQNLVVVQAARTEVMKRATEFSQMLLQQVVGGEPLLIRGGTLRASSFFTGFFGIMEICLGSVRSTHDALLGRVYVSVLLGRSVSYWDTLLVGSMLGSRRGAMIMKQTV